MARPLRSTLRVYQHDPNRLSLARRWLADRLGGSRDPGAELVLTELLSNAIEHGDGGPVEVSVCVLSATSVEVEVTNRLLGVPTLPDPSSTPPPTTNVRGRGLHLVRSLAAVEMEQSGSMLRVAARVELADAVELGIPETLEEASADDLVRRDRRYASSPGETRVHGE